MPLAKCRIQDKVRWRNWGRWRTGRFGNPDFTLCFRCLCKGAISRVNSQYLSTEKISFVKKQLKGFRDPLQRGNPALNGLYTVYRLGCIMIRNYLKKSSWKFQLTKGKNTFFWDFYYWVIEFAVCLCLKLFRAPDHPWFQHLCALTVGFGTVQKKGPRFGGLWRCGVVRLFA